jgi:cell division protein FtsI (penicillin-binding protein 3)
MGSPRVRLVALLVALAIAFGAVVMRVGQIQMRDADQLRSVAVEQWTRSYDIAAHRGTLFDRHGNELALSVPAATVSINPKLVENGPATIQVLDDLIGLDDATVAELSSAVAAKDRGFVFVARQIDADIGSEIASLRLAGVNVDSEDRRVMPGGDTGKSVIGRTDIDGTGVSGLELQYDDVLTGTGGTIVRQIAPRGRTVPGTEIVTEAPVAGQDLVLTLDRSIQFAAEQVLLERVTEIGAKGGTAIAMETETGDIYAMASVRQDSETGEYAVTNGNFAAVDAYEPGSVAKVITIAGALNEGVVEPETSFEVPWRKQYYDDLLSDSHQHPNEWMSVARILSESSNIGTIMVQERMNRFVHHDYLTAFGLGTATDLGFPGESTGILKPADELWGSERVTVAYGQGLSSTSIQLVAAVNTIANEGTYISPRLVKATVGPDGGLTEAPAAATRPVVSAEAAAQTTAMMKDVVCRGTGKSAIIDGLSVAGKTGTAFKVADDGTYFNEAGERIYYSSFVGFFPAEDPKITVLVSIDEPPAGTNDRFGGTAAAPVFAELVPTLLHETGITPPPGSVGCGAEPTP